jgi:hypothetical protein
MHPRYRGSDGFRHWTGSDGFRHWDDWRFGAGFRHRNVAVSGTGISFLVATGGTMRRFFQFWWQCCRIAFKGNSSFANSWQWMFGTPAVALIAYFAARNGLTELTTGHLILDAFLVALAAFIITWSVAFLVRLLRAPVDLVDAQIERARDVEAKLAAIVKPYPDWPIHELFSYIRPDLLERVDNGVGDVWDIVGNDIRDQASLGRLKIWGRVLRGGVDRLLGQRETLRPVEPHYWTDAFFTYSFFNETAEDKPQTYLAAGRSGPEYTDLRVNRIEAQAIWPK